VSRSLTLLAVCLNLKSNLKLVAVSIVLGW
jgi:hypothetical protein